MCLDPIVNFYAYAENTILLCKVKYNCLVDLLFDWFGFSCFGMLKLSTDLRAWLKQTSDASPYEVRDCSLDY